MSTPVRYGTRTGIPYMSTVSFTAAFSSDDAVKDTTTYDVTHGTVAVGAVSVVRQIRCGRHRLTSIVGAFIVHDQGSGEVDLLPTPMWNDCPDGCARRGECCAAWNIGARRGPIPTFSLARCFGVQLRLASRRRRRSVSAILKRVPRLANSSR